MIQFNKNKQNVKKNRSRRAQTAHIYCTYTLVTTFKKPNQKWNKHQHKWHITHQISTIYSNVFMHNTNIQININIILLEYYQYIAK